MEVDPGMYPVPNSVHTLNIIGLADIPASSSTVCLPYALIPGMNFNSPLFYKALSTLAKQQTLPTSSPSATKPTVSIPKVTPKESKNSGHTGLSIYIINLFALLKSLLF